MNKRKRTAVMQAVEKEPKTDRPDWTKHQQSEVNAKDSDQREKEARVNENTQVAIKMKTDYRDVAKAGDVWTTDAQKAQELVQLNRAEYVR